MNDSNLNDFSAEAMGLYLEQHFLLREKIQTRSEEKAKRIQSQIMDVFASLHKKIRIENPHVRVIVGLGGDFKMGRETYLMKYSVFCKWKEIFEYPNNLVSFIPPGFNTFMEFARYANTTRNSF